MAPSRLIRFFSRRQAKPSLPSKDKSSTIKNGLVCSIILLDGEEIHFEIERKALGKTLIDKVNAHLKLIESDYFGLQFIDSYDLKQWLDPTKSIKKQMKIGPPYNFRFRVKFYTSDPQNLHDELTRYLFVLQLQDDIRTGKLECPMDCDIELTALTMQAQLGDYNRDEHANIPILSHRNRIDQFEEQVREKWTDHYRGLTPADCEMQYLNKARWLEMYGVDLHTVMGRDGLEYRLGLTPTGILVFENQIKIGLFVWSKVTRIDFHRNKLTIVVVEDDDHDPRLQRDFVFLFRCFDEKQAKYFWKCALECHVFFRTTSASKMKLNSKTYLTRTASRFRFSGRTEYQTAALRNLSNSTNNFERKPSQRFSRRASYAIRKKIQEQEIRREQEDERLKKLKSEQEAKLVSNQDLTNVAKRLSVAQKTLPATQRLDNLILGTSNDVPSTVIDSEMNGAGNGPSPPPIAPRQTTPISLTAKPSNSNDQNNINTTAKETSSNSTIITNGHSNPTKLNSPPARYTLANSSTPTYVLQKSRNDNPNLNATFVTRTLSQSNVRHGTSTIVQSTSSPRHSLLLTSSSVIHHPITTEL